MRGTEMIDGSEAKIHYMVARRDENLRQDRSVSPSVGNSIRDMNMRCES